MSVMSTSEGLEEMTMLVASTSEEKTMLVASTVEGLVEKILPLDRTSAIEFGARLLPVAKINFLDSSNAVALEDSGGTGSSAELEEKTISVASTSATAGDLSALFTASVDSLPSSDMVAHRDSHDAGSSVEPKSEYFSVRVEEMMRTRSQFPSDVEHAIEYSRAHWSETTGLSGSSEIAEDQEWVADVDRENDQVFEELVNDPQWRWRGVDQFLWKAKEVNVQLGRKLAEGGQAEIFEAIFPPSNGLLYHDQVLKVFKRGTRLSDLCKQWPRGIVQHQDTFFFPPSWGLMLTDGRFAFAMMRCRGDLRNLIDESMQANNNQIPPFPYACNGKTLKQEFIMLMIADQIEALHKVGILHRDLKAANILVMDYEDGASVAFLVADFECSLGVVGTGFWRAPEVLVLLQERKPFEFTEAMDVYSYGMLCYEIVTGRLPFESELQACKASYNLVIAGQRPTLPSDVDVSLKTLIERCWHPTPSERPSFSRIAETLRPYVALKRRRTKTLAHYLGLKRRRTREMTSKEF